MCAASPLVSAESARLLEIQWRRCVLAIEAGDRRGAISLGRHLLDLAEEQDCLEEEWLQLFALRLEVMEHGHILTATIPNRIADSVISEPTRVKLYSLALCLNATENQRDGDTFRRLLTNGSELLRRYGAYTGMDFLAASVARQMLRLGQEDSATDLLSVYFRTQRRERSEPGFVFSGLEEFVPHKVAIPSEGVRGRSHRSRRSGPR
jgi:hypothetical protein